MLVMVSVLFSSLGELRQRSTASGSILLFYYYFSFMIIFPLVGVLCQAYYPERDCSLLLCVMSNFLLFYFYLSSQGLGGEFASGKTFGATLRLNCDLVSQLIYEALI